MVIEIKYLGFVVKLRIDGGNVENLSPELPVPLMDKAVEDVKFLSLVFPGYYPDTDSRNLALAQSLGATVLAKELEPSQQFNEDVKY